MLNDTYKNERVNKAEQFLQECVGWARLLDFLKQETSFLKTRLSMIVDIKADRDFLNEAEQYQNLFLLKDEFINELSKDVKQHQERIKEILLIEKPIEEKINKQQQKLRNEVERLEKDFTKIKNDFNKDLYKLL